MPALLNYTALDTYFRNNDPLVLDKLLVAPRKIYTGVKLLSEEDSKLYDKSSSYEQDMWHKSLDEETKLPHRADVYHVDFKSD